MPGAEGDSVAAVQAALIAAGVDLPGGVDGVYGDDTMVAVAAYQRRSGSLHETGAVDEDTARALGVYGKPLEFPSATTRAPATTISAAPPPPARASTPSRPAANERRHVGGFRFVVVPMFLGLVVAAMGWRRRGFVGRAGRRWASEEPSATSACGAATDSTSRHTSAEVFDDRFDDATADDAAEVPTAHT